MRARTIGAVVLVGAALAVIASTASGATSAQSASSITVWLQTDAQAANWEPIVKAANAQFQKDHPGVTVNVQYQTWGTHLQKLDATLAGGNAPDVIEMGNTEMTKYMAAGAFQDLSSDKASFPNSSSWLEGLAASGTVRRQALRRPLLRRLAGRHVPHRPVQEAGRQGPDQPRAVHGRREEARRRRTTPKGFSPVYIAGTDWYFAMSFVYDFGGSIATRVSGKWKGTLASPRSIAGLTAYKNFFTAASRASKTTDETHPNPYDVYAQGHAGSMVGPGWFSCCVGDQVQEPHRPVRDAEPHQGQADAGLPRRLRSRGARRRQQGARGRLDQGLHEHAVDDGTARIGNIPNTTSLLGSSVNEKAATQSWFVPTAKNWVNVENGNILRNMLAQILTGKLSIKQAAQSASDNITSVLNA